MLSSVLSSKSAVQVNIAIMRVFVKIRQMFMGHKDTALRLEKLEHTAGHHGKEIRSMMELIEKILAVEEKPRWRIGFCL